MEFVMSTILHPQKIVSLEQKNSLERATISEIGFARLERAVARPLFFI